MVLMIGITVFAGEPAIVKGTKNLMKAATKYVIIIGVSATSLFAGYHGVKYIMADKEEKPGIRKNILQILIGGAVVTTITSTVTWFLGFYSTSTSETTNAILIASNYIAAVLRY